ncbi:membrane hypothetical protein [Cupriavidus taiwanensis]|nr:membrane hypothetical protein [Cupriavidus taiwanensis]
MAKASRWARVSTSVSRVISCVRLRPVTWVSSMRASSAGRPAMAARVWASRSVGVAGSAAESGDDIKRARDGSGAAYKKPHRCGTWRGFGAVLCGEASGFAPVYRSSAAAGAMALPGRLLIDGVLGLVGAGVDGVLGGLLGVLHGVAGVFLGLLGGGGRVRGGVAGGSLGGICGVAGGSGGIAGGGLGRFRGALHGALGVRGGRRCFFLLAAGGHGRGDHQQREQFFHDFVLGMFSGVTTRHHSPFAGRNRL